MGRVEGLMFGAHAVAVVDVGEAHGNGAKREEERRAWKGCLQVVSQQERQ